MLFDIYMIILTAFAIFGFYCLAEQFIMAAKYSQAPKTVTILKYDGAISTYDTVQFLHNSLYNNEIVVLSDNPSHSCPYAATISQGELSQYITNALFTKPVN